MRECDILSPAGRDRREAILARCRGVLAARRRRRNAGRAALSLAVLAGAVAAAMWAGSRPSGALDNRGHHVADATGATTGEAVPAPPPAPSTEARSSVGLVRTDPGILERLASAGGRPGATPLSDDALLQELRELGVGAGLVRTRGRAFLVRHDAGLAGQADAPGPAAGGDGAA